MTKTNRCVRLCLAALTVLAGVAILPATTDANPNRLGIRGGVTDNADTGFVGMYGLIGTRSRVRVSPSLDFGFGDREAFDIFTLRGSANLEYAIPVGRSVDLFPIFGFSAIYTNFDDCVGDCDEIDAGANIGMGMQAERFRFELTLGVGDIPDLTLALGLMF